MAQPGQHLVVVDGRVVGDGDDQVPQFRIATDDLGIRDDREIAQPASFAGESPLPD